MKAVQLVRSRITYSQTTFVELLNAGLLDRAEGGGIVFPFEAVKVEFLLQAA